MFGLQVQHRKKSPPQLRVDDRRADLATSIESSPKLNTPTKSDSDNLPIRQSTPPQKLPLKTLPKHPANPFVSGIMKKEEVT